VGKKQHHEYLPKVNDLAKGEKEIGASTLVF